jgi:hypothetical protein
MTSKVVPYKPQGPQSPHLRDQRVTQLDQVLIT